MRQSLVRRGLGLSAVIFPLTLAMAAFHASAPAPPAPDPPTAVVIASAPQPIVISPLLRATDPVPTVRPIPTATEPPTPTVVAATPTSTARPTPTPRPAGTPPRVGLQVGHWKANEQPDELARFRTSTGAFAAGYTEVQVNLEVARRAAQQLQDQGVVVDILPATVPPGYDADAFVAIHADGSLSTHARGFKLATPWRASRASQHLLDTITVEYAATTGLPIDYAVSINMRGYYTFSYHRYQHAIARTTPAVIIEMGFLTNPTDRAMLIQQPDRLASGIARGIMRYLSERDPGDGAALLPPEFRRQRAASPDGVDVHAAPRDSAPVLAHVDADRRLNPIEERDGWYHVFVRAGERRVMGWVRKDLLVETNDPTPTPPPATDT